jgi:pantoate--beta-alanine ligase
VRAQDGLALSSRNAHLSSGERAQAASLSRALRTISESVLAGERDVAVAVAAGRAELAAAGVEPEYLSVVDADTMEPVLRIGGDVLALVAARIGTTRLIDNLPIRAGQTAVADTNHPVATLPGRAPTT